MSSSKADDIGAAPAAHLERAVEEPPLKGMKSRDVDVAMALFDSPEQMHEPIDPDDERKLVRKVSEEKDANEVLLQHLNAAKN
jgi:hypothetical protein